MNATYAAIGSIVVILFVYLLVALFKPEIF